MKELCNTYLHEASDTISATKKVILMSAEEINTLVVGGGQAGLAMSEHLSLMGERHLVLERRRIAERWRSERWDSLVTNGPAWHDRFPNMEFNGTDPDSFPTKNQVAAYFEDYAKMIKCPIRCGVNVESVERVNGHAGFHVHTSQGDILAKNVVVATGPFQRPVIPPIIPDNGPVAQMHSISYRNPGQLVDGAVLVVGSGSSGVQIADELLRAGRKVFLSVGPHSRPPRSYRGRDFVWWLGVLGKWEAPAMKPGTEHVTIAVSGAHGGATVDFRTLAHRGMTLLGMTQAYDKGLLTFAGDLAVNIARGDADYLALLEKADAYVEQHGIKLPHEPEARKFDPMPECVSDPILNLKIKDANIKTVIWATGFEPDYGWLKVDVTDAQGRPQHQRGVTAEPGLYFLGLPWQSRRGSAFIWGVWHDAKYLVEQIAIQKSYFDHHLAAQDQMFD